jgi:CBS domain containing-hemolysin-like protein
MPSYLLLALMLLLMAFFSGMEIAFLAANKLRIQLDRKQGGVAGYLVAWLTGRMELVIATSLVGMNVGLVIFGLKAAEIFEPLLGRYIHGHGWILLIQTLAATTMVLFTAEFLPKTFFRIRSNQMLRLFSVPFSVIYNPAASYLVHRAPVGFSPQEDSEIPRIKADTADGIQQG